MKHSKVITEKYLGTPLTNEQFLLVNEFGDIVRSILEKAKYREGVDKWTITKEWIKEKMTFPVEIQFDYLWCQLLQTPFVVVKESIVEISIKGKELLDLLSLQVRNPVSVK